MNAQSVPDSVLRPASPCSARRAPSRGTAEPRQQRETRHRDDEKRLPGRQPDAGDSRDHGRRSRRDRRRRLGNVGMVRFTDFPARAESLAREIESAQPDLIGLQEAEVWRSQTPADFVPGNAEHVEYDFVRLLLDALSARACTTLKWSGPTGVDVEIPGFLSESDYLGGVLSDIRLTEHEVILAAFRSEDLGTEALKPAERSVRQ